jgi:hypothetical protein
MEYVKLIPGDQVILGRHSIIDGKGMYSDFWGGSMDPFVGTRATIKSFARLCPDVQIPCYYIDYGPAFCAWRISDMTIIPNKRIMNNPYFWAKRLGHKLPQGIY